ncbi:hypothetical protein [Actinophytocola sp.]|uniref:baeRF2 domain-containing protein n=1 Tax=Actinophytocola sp. TaxID=1872138 RepID=UPI002D80979E|nr:hypothetical protein [Actinophytocola sp.]HET9142214.1 hypothetical protein [Actinophytocola sp.]
MVAGPTRTGADIHTGAGGGQPPRITSVLGPDDEIERNAPGGRAQSRYQHRAEDSWQHNAGAVAGARLLVISGDVRAVQLLEERLPAWIRTETTIRHITGGRSPDGSQPRRAETVVEVARATAAQWTGRLLSRFGPRRHRGPNATAGRCWTWRSAPHRAPEHRCTCSTPASRVRPPRASARCAGSTERDGPDAEEHVRPVRAVTAAL